MKYVLVVDQGTTSTRAILFDASLKTIASAQEEIPPRFPHPGYVEHDPEHLVQTTLRTSRKVLGHDSEIARNVVALGIANQRETTIVWDKKTGKAVYPAIVWQDRRTAPLCQRLRESGQEDMFRQKTGLPLDPYFSGVKIAWILDHIDPQRKKSHNGDLLFGTVDSYLIWTLTEGKVHATDATNASRTLLYDVRAQEWSPVLCDALNIPQAMLPDVKDCADDFGTTSPTFLGRPLPIRGVAGDQQAAMIGQACFSPGMIKATYGTGCFALLNSGTTPITSKNNLLTTVAYRLKGKTTYALEGSIFVAGAVVQWLRDRLKLIKSAEEIESLAAQADSEEPITLVPAFTGLGAPYWNPECRGAIFGLTRNTGPADFARAALESVGFQTRDLLEAMRADWPENSEILRVDGALSRSDWVMRFIADLLAIRVERPASHETTALGSAWLAGMSSGIFPDMDAFAATWKAETSFTPRDVAAESDVKYARWKKAVFVAQQY